MNISKKYADGFRDGYDHGYAAGYGAARKEIFEALQVQARWVRVSPMVDTVQCSACGGQLFSAELETPYCPYCGARMEVQE